MSADVQWPPIGENLNYFGGNWDHYLSHCYAKYYGDFYATPRCWPIVGQSLNIKRHPLPPDGRCKTFWHLITEGSDEENRTVVPARMERICWPRAILDEFNLVYPSGSSEKICWWKVKRGSEFRYNIALSDFSYLVVVADRRDYVLLWTAYPIEYNNKRRRLEKEFRKFWNLPEK